tara:strand:+ start:567 stop:935 length:369 start_codon:yes stop_codon:yes gene_type:complete
MKLMSMKQYSKMPQAKLLRKIMKALKKLPKMKLAKLCYDLEKSRLPTISTTKKGMPRLTARRAFERGTTKGMMYRGKETLAPRRIRDEKRIRKIRRTPKQLANDKRLGRMAKARAKARRRLR